MFFGAEVYDKVIADMIITKAVKDLKPALMEQDIKGLEIPCYEIVDKEQVIFVVSAGKNGAEFNKTLGYFSNFPGMQTYLCLNGSGILLMQRNDEQGDAKEFKVAILNSLKQVIVPFGWGVCLVNTGSGFLTVLRNSLLEGKDLVTESIIEKKGFAYYVIEKKGEIAFEQNPNYQMHPQITTEQ